MNWSVNPFRTIMGGALLTGLAIVQFFFEIFEKLLTFKFFYAIIQAYERDSNSF